MIKIMIVDDDRDVAGLAADMLEGEYATCTYNNSNEALAKFLEENPDLVIADCFMPKMGGLEMVIEMLRIKSDTKIIIFSGISSEIEKTRKACKEKGFEHFFEKPFNTKFIKKKVKEVLES